MFFFSFSVFVYLHVKDRIQSKRKEVADSFCELVGFLVTATVIAVVVTVKTTVYNSFQTEIKKLCAMIYSFFGDFFGESGSAGEMESASTSTSPLK